MSATRKESFRIHCLYLQGSLRSAGLRGGSKVKTLVHTVKLADISEVFEQLEKGEKNAASC
ncbi:hypothetical protein [Bacillus massilinigeriensis]|uniref:hypothetical protein n=1 Tax=Bacillus mediterraneensis TaxID=1805474 RepID=UPI0008F86956|nr:hypothetical protein [Bacillus mediterraneensis]